jgi:NAD(P) transhydrogenase
LEAVITTYDYDLVVIGSGPAGQRAAIQAAKLGKHVLVVERRAVVGGVCVNTGTIPSKTMREAALHLSGFRERSIYGASYSVKKHITMTDLLYRAENVIKHELDVIRHQLQRNGVEMIEAEASFADPHTLRLAEVQRKKVRDVTASKVVIAVGTSTALDSTIPFDGQRIFTSDDILELKELPRTLAVVGAGVIGCE